MFAVKRYGIILEKPNLSFENFLKMIETIIHNNMFPIVILQDEINGNVFLNYQNKINIIRDKYPTLREDNFLVIEPEFSITKNRFMWKKRLKEKVESINHYAFGTNDIGVDDKAFIVNIDKLSVIKNNFIFLSNEIDNILSDLLNIADVINMKSKYEEDFLPYIDHLFKKRDYSEIYYDESFGTVFKSKIKTVTGNQAYIFMEDKKYIDLINKYDLGEKLFSTFAVSLDVDDTDIEVMDKFLSNNDIKYTRDSNSMSISKNGKTTIKIENI